MRKSWKLLLPGLLLGLGGCATTMSEPVEPVPAPNFNYEPPAVAAPGSAEMVFVVVAPEWANDDEASRGAAEHVFGELRDALKDNFIEVLLARGYTTRGDVYSSRDELLYGDKQESDFLIVPELEIDFRFDQLSPGGVPEIPVIGYFAVDGQVTIQGRVVLNVYETLTNERLWTKPISVEPRTISWVGEARHRDTTLKDQQRTWPALAVSDPGFQRAFIPEMNAIFSRVMETSWNHMDPRDFAAVKVQADAIKAKAVTTVR